jgi:hypothetical protein
MQDVLNSNSHPESRTIRVIVKVSEDLKELRGIYPPGNSEEEDLKIEAAIREKFGV